MNILPKIKKCPNCKRFNFFRLDLAIYENHFIALKNWSLKKIISCKKCRIEIGLFINEHTQDEKFIWMDFIRCEENYFHKLEKLQKSKEKYKDKNKEKEFLRTIKQIQDIQNQIRLDQTKIKVKAKIQNIAQYI